MNKALMAKAVEIAAILDPQDRLRFYGNAAYDLETIPLSIDEDLQARALTGPVGLMYHGGQAGLRLGDTLLPSYLSGQTPTQGPKQRFVYVTRDKHHAASYAWKRHNNLGCATEVYEVLPSSDVTISNNCFRFRQMLIADGGFSEDTIEKYTYREFTATCATVLRTVGDHEFGLHLEPSGSVSS